MWTTTSPAGPVFTALLWSMCSSAPWIFTEPVRFGVGPFNTEEHIQIAVDAVKEIAGEPHKFQMTNHERIIRTGGARCMDEAPRREFKNSPTRGSRESRDEELIVAALDPLSFEQLRQWKSTGICPLPTQTPRAGNKGPATYWQLALPSHMGSGVSSNGGSD